MASKRKRLEHVQQTPHRHPSEEDDDEQQNGAESSSSEEIKKEKTTSQSKAQGNLDFDIQQRESDSAFAKNVERKGKTKNRKQDAVPEISNSIVVKANDGNGDDGIAIDGKKVLFRRVWSDKDEVILLKGVFKFVSEQNVDPAKDFNLFFNFIKNRLQFDAHASQVKDKIWRLKRRYVNKSARVEDGKPMKFASSHENKLFKISEKIWGNEGILGHESKSVLTKKNSVISSCPIKIEAGELNAVLKSKESRNSGGRGHENLKKFVPFFNERFLGRDEAIMKCDASLLNGETRDETLGNQIKFLTEKLNYFLAENGRMTELVNGFSSELQN